MSGQRSPDRRDTWCRAQVRVKCLQRGVLVRDYILELLAKDGIR
jgi:hypothetical protein